jgi:hypothetical protein
VYVDTGLGYGGQVSITYECHIYSSEKLAWFGRVGAGAAYKWSSDNDIFRTNWPGYNYNVNWKKK